MEIKEAANWIMATLSHLHSSFYDGPAATNFVFPGDLLTINAIRSYCWNPPTPPIPVPQLATILPAILAVGGLIKLAVTTKVIPIAVKTDEQAEMPMEGAAMFIEAVIISQVAQASEKILALEHTIEGLKDKHKLEIRKKAKRKEKQKKSKAAKKGHATKNDAKKAKAIEMYKSGSYHSVLQAAAKIAPEVGLSESTVKKLLYKLKNNHT